MKQKYKSLKMFLKADISRSSSYTGYTTVGGRPLIMSKIVKNMNFFNNFQHFYAFLELIFCSKREEGE